MRSYQKIFGVLIVWDGMRFLWAATWVDFWLKCGVTGTQLAHLKSWTALVCVIFLWLLPRWQQYRKQLFLLGIIGTAGQFLCMLMADRTESVVWLYGSEACNATALAAIQCVARAYLIGTYQKQSSNSSTEQLLVWESRCGLVSALIGLCLGTWAYTHNTQDLLNYSCLLSVVLCAVAVSVLPSDCQPQHKSKTPEAAHYAALRPIRSQFSCVLIWLCCAVVLQMTIHGWPWLLFQASHHQMGLGWTALSAAAQLMAQGFSSIAWRWARGHHTKTYLSTLVIVLGLLSWCWHQQWLLGCVAFVALLTLLTGRIMLRCQVQLHDALLEEQRVAVEATLGCMHRLLVILLMTGISVVNAV